MTSYIYRILSFLLPSLEWSVSTKEKTIFLTFDDGPVPGVTEYVLDLLNKFNAKATFFCVGDNVRKHPDIFQRIIAEGHAVGNHTYNHLDGWKSSNTDFYLNIQTCNEIMKQSGMPMSNDKILFRPPYGKITPVQIRFLKKHFRIIMWDVLTGDYNPGIPGEKCLQRALAADSGSIVIFHDSYKAEQNLRFALPEFLKHYSERGYTFKSL